MHYLYSQINWEGRLIAILGARGVGKSTILLHILLTGKENTPYITADDFYFSQHRLFDMALAFYQQGGKRLLIDEIHKYHGWSNEIKNIYDPIPQLQLNIHRLPPYSIWNGAEQTSVAVSRSTTLPLSRSVNSL